MTLQEDARQDAYNDWTTYMNPWSHDAVKPIRRFRERIQDRTYPSFGPGRTPERRAEAIAVYTTAYVLEWERLEAGSIPEGGIAPPELVERLDPTARKRLEAEHDSAR